jgi:lysophospholipase L1-like esterase
VSVGGALAYGVTRDDPQTIRFTVQGSASPGTQSIEVKGANGGIATGSIEYSPPVDARFRRVVAFGASLTMGVQNGTLALRSQVHGPMAQLARAMSAYLSLPLVKDGYMPSIGLTDFDHSTCKLNGDLGTLLEMRGVDDLVPKLTDDRGDIHVEWARVDPTVEVRDVAVGGHTIVNVTNGGRDLFGIIFEHLIWDPYVKGDALLEAPMTTMLDRIAAMKPTLIVTTDLFVNDFNVDLSGGGDKIPDLAGMTSLEDFDRSFNLILTRLDDTGADYFVGTCPDVTKIRGVPEKVAALLAAGHSEPEATGWTQAMKDRLDAFNDRLRSAAMMHPKLHVIELGRDLDDALANGRDVAGVHLYPKPFGGLLSLDGLHFSDTGYALLAQEYIQAINDALGTKIPDIDLAAVLADDPYSVENLRAAGFTCAGQ